MSKNAIVALVAVAAAFALGYHFGRERTAQAAANGRVYELRTYTTNEGKFDALNARFRNHTMKLFEKHGMKNVGYWIPVQEPASKNTLIYILSYPDRDAAKQSWQAFGNDPEWKKVWTESEKGGQIVAKVDSVFMEPTDYSAMK